MAWSSSRKSTSSSTPPSLLRHELRRVQARRSHRPRHRHRSLPARRTPLRSHARNSRRVRPPSRLRARHRHQVESDRPRPRLCLQEVAKANQLSVHITITTLNVELARILEPRAPRPDLRLDAVRALSRGRIARRRELLAGGAGNHRFAERPGSLDPRRRRGRRRLRFRQPAVSEALLGGRVSSLPRAKLSRIWPRTTASAIRIAPSFRPPMPSACRN